MVEEKQKSTIQPLNFSFKVSIANLGDIIVGELCGFDQAIRRGISKNYANMKMPKKKYGSIILNEGVCAYDKRILTWCNIRDIIKRIVTIGLLNENKELILTWKLTNACPLTLTVGEFNESKHCSYKDYDASI